MELHGGKFHHRAAMDNAMIDAYLDAYPDAAARRVHSLKLLVNKNLFLLLLIVYFY